MKKFISICVSLLMLLSVFPYTGIAAASEIGSVFLLDRNYLYLNSTEDSYSLQLVNTTGDNSLTWSSSNEQVATVADGGVIEPVAAGKTIIRVENDSGDFAECAVSIRETLTQGIRISKPYILAEYGQTIQLELEAADGVDISNAVWQSSHTNRCTVTQTGLVTIMANTMNQATITVTAGGYTDTCNVYITESRANGRDSVSSNSHFMTNKNDEEQLLQYMYYNPNNDEFAHYATLSNDGAWIDENKGKVKNDQMIGDFSGYQAAVAYRAPYTGTLRVFFNNGAHSNSVAGIRIMHDLIQEYPADERTCVYTDDAEVTTVGTRFVFPTITLADPTQFATQWATGVPIDVKAGDYIYVLSVYANGKEGRGNGLISYNKSFEFKYDSYESEQYVDIQDKESFVIAGQTLRINAVANTGSLSYYSSDPDVASVDSVGTITANNEGTCKIYAVADGVASYKEVTVSDSIFSLDRNYLRLSIQDTYPLQLVNTTGDDNVTWSSSDEQIAMVTNTGYVIPVAEGEATIRVENSSHVSDECHVFVRKALTEGIRIDTPYILGEYDQIFQLGIEAADGVDISNPVWHSSNTNICTVSETGLVKILTAKINKATITVTAGDYTDTCDVYITGSRESGKDSVSSNAHFMMNKNDDEQLLQYMYYNPSNQTFTHYSSLNTQAGAWFDNDRGNIKRNQMVAHPSYPAALAYRAPYTGTLRIFFNNGADLQSVAGLKIMKGTEKIYPNDARDCVYTDDEDVTTVEDKLVFPTISLNDPSKFATEWAEGIPVYVNAGEYVYVLSVFANRAEGSYNGLMSYNNSFEFKYDSYMDDNNIIIPNKTIFTQVGQTVNANVISKNKFVSYSSSDSSVASVDDSGNITAVATGNCKIYVLANGVASYIDVNVGNVPIDEIKVSEITKNSDGTLNIKVKAASSISDRAVAIVAAYDSDSLLNNVHSSSENDINSTSFTEFEIHGISVNNSQKLSLFVWKGLRDIEPLMPEVTLLDY